MPSETKFCSPHVSHGWQLTARSADVKRIRNMATGLIFALFASSTLLAQNGTAIAVLDVNSVFENSIRFKHAMNDIKSDIKNYEAEVIGHRQTLGKQREALGTYKPDSQQYRTLEKQLATMTANLQIDMQLKKKDFMEREAKIYFQAYTELERFVGDYSTRRGISLVVRFHGGKMNDNSRESVLAGVNRPIVFHDQSLDITQAIVEMVNHGVAPARVGNRNQVPLPRR
ncbi:MAG TPA: OmpH family outer membrane protein [Planctomycetes bacterium]|nr:OmpH family outer membrane protein [Planctomycetota bacterium]